MLSKLAITLLPLAILPGTALAADLPARIAAPPPTAPPAFTWSGLYFGTQVGFVSEQSSARLYNAATNATIANGAAGPHGIIGGAHVGYQIELPTLLPFGASRLRGLIGFEGDVDGTTARTAYPVGFVNAVTSRPLQGSARGRLGVAADHLLLYATGGAAFAYQRSNYSSLMLAPVSNEINQGRVGYTIGGGVDYAFTNNLSVGVEYRFTDYGRFTDNLPLVTPGAADNAGRRETNNRVQVSFSYRVDPPPATPPVVARY